MKFYRWLFAFFVALLTVVILLWLVQEPSGSTGTAHPDYGAMQHSGPDISSSQPVQWLAISFGGLIVLILITCVIIGYLRQDRLASDRNPLLWIGAVYVLVYTGLIVLYLNYVDGGTIIYILGFPMPTAWMIYVFWLFPVAFTFYYVRKFDSWVFKPSSMEEFLAILDQAEIVDYDAEQQQGDERNLNRKN